MPHGFFRSMSGTACGDQQASDFPGNHVANNALDKLIAWVDQRRDELTRDGWYLEADAEEIRKKAAMIASEWSRDGAF